jgi:hypothetical protein
MRFLVLIALAVVAPVLVSAQTVHSEPLEAPNVPNWEAPFDQPMEFYFGHSGGNCTTCAWLAAEGVITPDTPSKFKEVARVFPPGVIVHFHSPGGNLAAGLELGRLIRAAGGRTEVSRTVFQSNGEYYDRIEPGVCASACAYAFLGGVDRELKNGPEGHTGLGFHQFYSPEGKGGAGDAQIVSAIILNYLIEMGVNLTISSLAALATPDQINWVDEKMAESWGLSNADISQDVDWKIVATDRGAVLRASYKADNKKYATHITLSCKVEDRILVYATTNLKDSGKGAHFDDLVRTHPNARIRVGISKESSDSHQTDIAYPSISSSIFRSDSVGVFQIEINVRSAPDFPYSKRVFLSLDAPHAYGDLLFIGFNLPTPEETSLIRKNCAW